MNRRHINIVIGNRAASPDIDFTFTVATTVPDFIAQASGSSTDLAMFMPPGNLEPDPARPDSTQEEEAASIVKAIKTKHPIPIVVIAAQADAREPVLAAEAECFLDVPALPGESAVATCLNL